MSATDLKMPRIDEQVPLYVLALSIVIHPPKAQPKRMIQQLTWLLFSESIDGFVIFGDFEEAAKKSTERRSRRGKMQRIVSKHDYPLLGNIFSMPSSFHPAKLTAKRTMGNSGKYS